MSRKATQFQKKAMASIYKGKGIFKPLNTGRIDDHVATVREWIANIFFYKKAAPCISGCRNRFLFFVSLRTA